MTNLAKLAEETAKLDDKLSACMKCGTCQSVCPIFKETLMEADVARGKLSLLSDIENKVAKDAEGVRGKLDRCLLCGSCQAACPSGVSILDIFIKAREISAQYMGLSPIKKIIFRRCFAIRGFFPSARKCRRRSGDCLCAGKTTRRARFRRRFWRR